MTPWSYQRIESFLEMIEVHAGLLRSKAATLDCTQVPAREWLRDVDEIFNSLRTIKALLVRERKSKA